MFTKPVSQDQDQWIARSREYHTISWGLSLDKSTNYSQMRVRGKPKTIRRKKARWPTPAEGRSWAKRHWVLQHTTRVSSRVWSTPHASSGVTEYEAFLMLQVMEPNVKHPLSFERWSLKYSVLHTLNNKVEYEVFLMLQAIKFECEVLLVLQAMKVSIKKLLAPQVVRLSVEYPSCSGQRSQAWNGLHWPLRSQGTRGIKAKGL